MQRLVIPVELDSYAYASIIIDTALIYFPTAWPLNPHLPIERLCNPSWSSLQLRKDTEDRGFPLVCRGDRVEGVCAKNGGIYASLSFLLSSDFPIEIIRKLSYNLHSDAEEPLIIVCYCWLVSLCVIDSVFHMGFLWYLQQRPLRHCIVPLCQTLESDPASSSGWWMQTLRFFVTHV